MTTSIDIMIGKLSAKDSRKPYIAMEELVKCGESAIEPLIIALRQTNNMTVRDRIITTLTRIGRPAIPDLIDTYTNELDPKIKMAAIDALGEIADPSALPILISALQDSDAKVRHLADYGITQIQQANPKAEITPSLARDIEKAKATPSQPTSLYLGISPTSGRNRVLQVISNTLRRWVFGIDSPEEIRQADGNPFARWMLRPFRKGLSFSLACMLFVYVVICVWEGIGWATRLSPTYGFIIIRVIVIALLSLLSAFTLPFVSGFFLLFAIVNVALLFFPLGVIHGFTLSPNGELHAQNNQRNEALVVSLAITAFVLLPYGYDILTGSFTGLIIGYILVSPLRIFVLGIGILLLVGTNLYHSIKAQQPIQQPLA